MRLHQIGLVTWIVLISPTWAATPSPLTSQQTLSAESQQQSLKTQAEQWGLNTEEYQRYQQLLNGPRGIQSPGIDPLTTLGIEAESDAERRRYAEQWVKAEFARTEKELRFQREVDAAWKRLFPDMLPVNMAKSGEAKGRLALFVKINDCPPCDARLAEVLALMQPVDIYLVDSKGNDDILRQWAKNHRIPVERVRNRQVTLNHDAGYWFRFGQGVMPVLLRQGEQGWQISSL
ncbi:TIGR03759 family integrating conjugative element protein [Xenorhabdus nematophila]|uniref:TIGR03759 family integrating conjugative element protein n=1 Tax=Xenorhabdus nematophila TaxID=628 RepID=UPI000542140A|nr:TIGR03759 family integrating conjugative element protein [Xenorhabdus nematophila]CEF30189.1 putative exported protein [Xenorhabdus nematophila str. Websteri]AYA39346.1 TIGR03759 family integrating conjugative element protein [Xenorhabdus nematophila]KHD27151.1 conjugal transfer protein [Xenorhabdus nematophila]MBA0017921.1 TIGR03759 family integrating conjugative element protein [Xenorhabdus nematophila]MCB4426869.1 TIGR03759 family integrating conjugative element protein [Xenorhabdus nema